MMVYTLSIAQPCFECKHLFFFCSILSPVLPYNLQFFAAISPIVFSFSRFRSTASGAIRLVQLHMIVNGAPGTVGVRCDTEIAVSPGVFSVAGSAVAGLHYIAGFGRHSPHGVIGIMIFDLTQKPVGQNLPLRVFFCGTGLIDMGRKHLAAQCIVHSRLEDHRHIRHRAVVVKISRSPDFLEVA